MRRVFVLAYINPDLNHEEFLKFNNQSYFETEDDAQKIKDAIALSGMYDKQYLSIIPMLLMEDDR